MIRTKQARKIGKYYNINFNIIPISEWRDGLNVELEHGSKFGQLLDVTKDDIKKTAKIVIVHLLEDPKYYYYLKKLEKKREDYWKKREKPVIFKP